MRSKTINHQYSVPLRPRHCHLIGPTTSTVGAHALITTGSPGIAASLRDIIQHT